MDPQSLYGLYILLLYVLVLIPYGVGGWALRDAFRTPDEQWAAIGRSRNRWLALLGVGLLTWAVALVPSVAYLGFIRPKLRAAAGGAFGGQALGAGSPQGDRYLA